MSFRDSRLLAPPTLSLAAASAAATAGGAEATQAGFPGKNGRIVFNDQTGNLVLVNRDGTGLVRLVNTRAGDQYIGASFSADGTRIAYSGLGKTGNADVFTIRPDGSDQ